MKNKELRELGLKVTLPRLKVLRILEKADPHHISAEDIFKKLLAEGEDVSLATVYRVLTQFETAGLVIRHHFEGDSSIFELNQGEHHDHLVCVSCGKVIEFMDEKIEQCQEKIAKKHKFRITAHEHIIYGVCEGCDYIKISEG